MLDVIASLQIERRVLAVQSDRGHVTGVADSYPQEAGRDAGSCPLVHGPSPPRDRGWLAVAVLASVLSHAIGPSYSTVFGIPGTESQRARELLKRDFPAQSGDADTIVFHVAHGTIDSPEARAAILPLLARVAVLPHVAGIVSPYSAAGAVQVSADRMTAFATVNYDEQANLLSNNAGKPLLAEVKAVHAAGLQVAAGGQVVQQAEGFSVGPATGVGVIAALLILLLTFGSLAAAGLPLITAGLGCLPVSR